MDFVTPTPRALQARPLAIPNLLTYARIAAVPAVVGCLYWQDVPQHGPWLRWVAVLIFISAALTDILDGYLARRWGEDLISAIDYLDEQGVAHRDVKPDNIGIR